MTLVKLGNGFIFCLTESRTALQRGMRYAGITSCITLFIIAIASFGCLNEAWSRYLESLWLYNELPSTGRKLRAAHDIILFAWAIVLMVFGVLVLSKIRHSHMLKNVSCPCLVQQHQRHEIFSRVLVLTLSHPCSQQFYSSSPLYSIWLAVFTALSMFPSSSPLRFLGTTRCIRPSCYLIWSWTSRTTPWSWPLSCQSLSVSATYAAVDGRPGPTRSSHKDRRQGRGSDICHPFQPWWGIRSMLVGLERVLDKKLTAQFLHLYRLERVLYRTCITIT